MLRNFILSRQTFFRNERGGGNPLAQRYRTGGMSIDNSLEHSTVCDGIGANGNLISIP